MHEYMSTACHHGKCGTCRKTCKYCDSPCRHSCHQDPSATSPLPWVDQARGIAGELLHLVRLAGFLPDDLVAHAAFRDRVVELVTTIVLGGIRAAAREAAQAVNYNREVS